MRGQGECYGSIAGCHFDDSQTRFQSRSEAAEMHTRCAHMSVTRHSIEQEAAPRPCCSQVYRCILTLMTSKGLVMVGPRMAALPPDTMDCHAASCLPSPSCLPAGQARSCFTGFAKSGVGAAAADLQLASQAASWCTRGASRWPSDPQRLSILCIVVRHPKV